MEDECRGSDQDLSGSQASTQLSTTGESRVSDSSSSVHLQQPSGSSKRKRSSRDLRGLSAENRQSLDPKFRELSESIVSRCYKASQRIIGRYRSDIFDCINETQALRICNKLRDLGHQFYTRSFSLICQHGAHVHIIHDCTFPGNGTCRCAFIQKTKAEPGVRFRPSILRPTLFSDLSISDWEHIIFYFTEKRRGRRTHEIRIFGRVEKIPTAVKDYQNEGREGYSEEGSLEICGELDGPEFRREHEVAQVSEKGSRGRSVTSKGKRQRRETIHQKILDFMMNYPCSPIVNIINHPLWLEDDDLKFMRADNKIVKDVIDMFMAQLCTWNLYDFNSLYKRIECKPSFAGGFVDNNDYYYNISDSVNILIKLLEHQFQQDYDRINEFMSQVYNIIEKKIPKTNCILICSPPSSGKNFFFDVFIDYLLNKGQLGRANRFNQFAFQDAFTKRIILWNEPNFESSMVDTIKMMTAGDAYNVNVKHKSNCGVFKTPLIILTNNKISLMYDEAFKDRIIQYHWQAAPFLKDCSKKPTPLAAFELFKYFNLVTDNVKVRNTML
uniref:NS1 n=1 Tax=uncultured densovirus TaxID=748192 RepID=A0A7L7YUH0_9VIRU|nr:NS1 [uncultured densovirus]QRG24236.1 non-structural protein 1 [Densovirinae sp.]